MPSNIKAPVRNATLWAIGLALAVAIAGAADKSTTAPAENAKRLLKSMSDYMAAQKAISFDYDTVLEVVTKENQKLGLASSGSMRLNRPNKIHATRKGGFADVEYVYNGKTLAMLGKNGNVYSSVEWTGT